MRGWLKGTLNKTEKFKKLWRMEEHLGALGQLGWFLLSSTERLPSRETGFREQSAVVTFWKQLSASFCLLLLSGCPEWGAPSYPRGCVVQWLATPGSDCLRFKSQLFQWAWLWARSLMSIIPTSVNLGKYIILCHPPNKVKVVLSYPFCR